MIENFSSIKMNFLSLENFKIPSKSHEIQKKIANKKIHLDEKKIYCTFISLQVFFQLTHEKKKK